MSSLFPKYHELICNTYTPPFVPGPTQSTLQSENVKRSRLVAGGTFFRSVDHGADYRVNDIILECVVTFTGNTGVNTDNYIVDFKITDQDGAVTIIPTFSQAYDNDLGNCVLNKNGVINLRSKLASNVVVNCPIKDVVQPWDSSTNGSQCLLTSFGPTNLSGGIGLPPAPINVRTGPAFTLYHANLWDGNDDGSTSLFNKIFEWDGTQWINHPSTLYHPDSPPPCP